MMTRNMLTNSRRRRFPAGGAGAVERWRSARNANGVTAMTSEFVEEPH